jgi:MoaA/NifB/PqqE/SkfB family radical SAM enzyme
MKTSVNIEITRKFNANCLTCPRKAIKTFGDISLENFKIILKRIYQDRKKISMVNMSGYGETILHKDFFKILDLIKEFNYKLKSRNEKEIKFAVVTNGYGLDEKKLKAIEGVLDRVSISFATINPENYPKVHCGLRYEKVVEKIKLARKILQKTRIVLHLTPTRFTMKDIEPTVKYWRARGIKEIILFPFTFNRSGELNVTNTHLDIDQKRNLKLAKKLKLKQLEEVFIPGIKELIQIATKKIPCLARLACLYIDFKGNYHYCINDIADKHITGNIKERSISEILKLHDKIHFSGRICKNCNMRSGVNKTSLVKIMTNSLFALKD